MTREAIASFDPEQLYTEVSDCALHNVNMIIIL